MDPLSRALRFTNYPQFKVLLLAWVAALVLIPLLIRIAFRIGALDFPHSYKKHANPVPFLGGLGVYLAFALAVFSAASIIPKDADLGLSSWAKEGSSSRYWPPPSSSWCWACWTTSAR